MAITVAELIAEPQLGLTLLAGAAGLDNRITWAHTSDLPRLWEWVTGGELMMTNGLSIPADADGQVALAEALMDSGASALAIGEKMHAPTLTAEFLAACDRLPLPLVNIPYPLPFIAIARSVAESSLLEESRRLRQTARVYDLLRTAGASEDHWQSLVQRLATELDAARMLTLKAADSRQRGNRSTLDAAMAKLFASESAHRAADKAMQILASSGYRRGSTVERLFRDVRATEIYQGTSEVQRMIIAEQVLRGRNLEA